MGVPCESPRGTALARRAWRACDLGPGIFVLRRIVVITNSSGQWSVTVGDQRLVKPRFLLLATDHRPLATAFQYQPIGASFKLMWTCLVSKYSSMPQGPSSRPKPDCL